jgi:PDZ domain-containing protein
VGNLQAGDAIDLVNDKPVANLDEFTAILKSTKPGDQLVVDYRRKGGSIGTATITLGKNPDRDYGFLGVAVQDAPWANFTIDFNLANIGGPSAGLMFSLAVIDKLTTGDLNDGKFVAGTGTITSDGKVGPIGGITHKMMAAREAGATIFLVPAENSGAVEALHTVSAGGEPPSC